ncbi:MAG: hypothetical protein HYV28_09920 [Ignavibacteriales bacterium]|nr:hypothetical protein [Ignavibacteriales bacterium]
MQQTHVRHYEFRHRLDRANKMIAEGKELHAIQLLYKLIEDFPEDEQAVIALASVYEKSGNIISAEEAVKKGLDNNPANIQLRLFAGHFYFKQLRWQDSIDALSGVVPEEEPLAAFLSAYAYYHLHDYIFAKRYFLIYIANPVSGDFKADAFYYAAKISIELGEYQEAFEYLRKAEELAGDRKAYPFLYAVIYYYLGMHTHALDAIEKSISLEEINGDVFEWAGKISLQCKRYDKAERYLRKSIEKYNHTNPAIHANLGIACLYNKKLSDAQHFFELALAQNPNESTAQLGMKKINTEYYLFER